MSSIAVTATRGDTIDLEVTVTRDGAPVDLTGADLWFTAKLKVKDADVDAVAQKTVGSGITVTDAVNGEALITLDPADTDGLTKETTLYCDVQLVEASGRVTTVASGTLTILRDVTRVTA